MRLYIIVCLSCLSLYSRAQNDGVTIPADTSALNVNQFAMQLAAAGKSNYEKAVATLSWLSTNFAWTATDYKRRTVKEIIVRKGGNCFELAKVYMALLKESGIRHRPIAEINLHKTTDERGVTAAQKVKESGFRMSVFGRQHNDHRWVEIYDERTADWIPADPTMGIIGFDQWLKARAWFGERHTINDQFSDDMLAPFAIFVANPQNTGEMTEDRTSRYMVKELDALYGGALSKLPSWDKWVKGIASLNKPALNAFANKENLHDHVDAIAALVIVYNNLRDEYLQSVRAQ
jgi:hypothetical protein